jgi:hypothetical protein
MQFFKPTTTFARASARLLTETVTQTARTPMQESWLLLEPGRSPETQTLFELLPTRQQQLAKRSHCLPPCRQRQADVNEASKRQEPTSPRPTCTLSMARASKPIRATTTNPNTPIPEQSAIVEKATASSVTRRQQKQQKKRQWMQVQVLTSPPSPHELGANSLGSSPLASSQHMSLQPALPGKCEDVDIAGRCTVTEAQKYGPSPAHHVEQESTVGRSGSPDERSGWSAVPVRELRAAMTVLESTPTPTAASTVLQGTYSDSMSPLLGFRAGSARNTVADLVAALLMPSPPVPPEKPPGESVTHMKASATLHVAGSHAKDLSEADGTKLVATWPSDISKRALEALGTPDLAEILGTVQSPLHRQAASAPELAVQAESTQHEQDSQHEHPLGDQQGHVDGCNQPAMSQLTRDEQGCTIPFNKVTRQSRAKRQAPEVDNAAMPAVKRPLLAACRAARGQDTVALHPSVGKRRCVAVGAWVKRKQLAVAQAET